MDAGWPKWSVDSDKVAVILGNAIGGEKHYLSSMRIQLPEALRRVAESATLQTLPADMQHKIVEEARALYPVSYTHLDVYKRQGLIQAQQVFGYTRLMVAAFGLGGGWEALDLSLIHI